MIIVFICGSLQPGRDGVGDYTLRLAGELNKAGHTASIIAINDRYQKNTGVEHVVPRLINHVQVLRIPSLLSFRHRRRIAKSWIEQTKPAWVSLQYVPFSFQKKGLPLAFGSYLKRLNGEFKWHIMFHELWVGMPEGASKKYILWGWLQKQIVKALIYQLTPGFIHTSCQLYHKQLIRLGYKVEHMPLFSNIPVISSRHDLQHISSTTPISTYEDAFWKTFRFPLVTLIMFGTIHPQSLRKEFIEQVLKFKKHYKIQFKLTLIGRCGPFSDFWISDCKAVGIAVDEQGELPVESISHLLRTATIGISTTAFPIIDKSGTVAAMLAHKLPVICVGNTWVPRGVEAPKAFDGVFPLKDGCIEACLVRQKAGYTQFLDSDAAEKLVIDLQNQ